MAKKELNILIAEDNEANQAILERILVKAGHHVKVVSNGREALDELNHIRYDLCLIDLRMPVMSGNEAIKLYKNNQPESTLSFIVISADDTDTSMEICKKAGADLYLLKPVHSKVLLQAVMSVSLKQQNSFADTDTSVIDLKRFDYFNDQKFLDEYIILFQSSAEKLITQLAEVLDNDFSAFREIIHTIKGLSGNIGASVLLESAMIADKLDEEDYRKSSYHHFSQISNELSKVSFELAKLSSLNSSVNTSVNTSVIKSG